jgi:hypothetical protein
MELLSFVTPGIPLLVLGMLVVLDRINTKVTDIQEDIRDIKQSITWKDTCVERHDAIDRRLEALERSSGLNGNHTQGGIA